MKMLSNIFFQINQLHLIPKGVEFQEKFLYIGMVMDKKYFEKVILSHQKDNVATARIVIEPGALLALSKDKKITIKESQIACQNPHRLSS